MLCEKCRKNPANTHIKTMVNGQVTEWNLCSQCAADMGYQNILGGFSLGIGDLLGTVMGGSKAPAALRDEIRCEGCGSTLSEISRTGKAGCAKCYTTFYDQLLPSLQRIHGKTRHAGKLPSSAGAQAKQRRHLDELHRQLSQAIESQAFEKAAKLRDQIQQIEREADSK
jgi:protein arginine kinase activator